MFFVSIQIIEKDMHGRRHGRPSLENDINELVNSLLQERVFDNIPGRAYRAFRGFTHFTSVTDIQKFTKLVKHHQYMAALERDIILNN